MNALKTRIKYTDVDSPSVSKTIDIPNVNATDAHLRNFATAVGTLIDGFTMVTLEKITYTNVEGE